MGKDVDVKRGRSRKGSDNNSMSSSSESECPDRRRKSRRSSSHRERSRNRSKHGFRKEDGSREKSKMRKERTREKRSRKRRSVSSGRDGSEHETPEPETLVRLILESFPDVASDLKHLLQMIDNGQGADIRGIPNKGLVKLLKELFSSLKLRQNELGAFLLPPMSLPTLEIVGSTFLEPIAQPPSLPALDKNNDAFRSTKVDHVNPEIPTPNKRRFIGPEMPSRELLDAAAKLTEAETILRESDDGLLIGPPPPAMVAEAESANEAERFEEVGRIVGSKVDEPYDVLGVNWKMPFDNIKKRYWKLTLLVHPDKCSHPQAHEAFVILNQAFKDVQDPDKRKTFDEKIRLKEEQEEFEAELKILREAAQWRRLQGISMEGDDEILAVAQEAPKREEWMTTLPPERKPGMTMQSRTFSRTTKEGRGDTSSWTDNPLDKAEKAKQNYLEAYDKTIALADTDDKKKTGGSMAYLVDKYNSSKRSVSLVQKHQEESSRPKKKSKLPSKEWEGAHPWKPWDREKDLTAGRKKVNLDAENMTQGLSSRFSSGAVQRNFL